MDSRQLWQSKKGLGFLVTVGSIVLLTVLSVVCKADVQNAINSIMLAFGGLVGTQGAIDFKNAGVASKGVTDAN